MRSTLFINEDKSRSASPEYIIFKKRTATINTSQISRLYVFHIYLFGKYLELRNKSFESEPLNPCLISLIIFRGEILTNGLTLLLLVHSMISTHLVASPFVITSFIFHDFHLVSRYRVEEIKRYIFYLLEDLAFMLSFLIEVNIRVNG